MVLILLLPQTSLKAIIVGRAHQVDLEAVALAAPQGGQEQMELREREVLMVKMDLMEIQEHQAQQDHRCITFAIVINFSPHMVELLETLNSVHIDLAHAFC